MPCGGIVPIKHVLGTIQDELSPGRGGCWICDRGGCTHFVIEWDAYIHAKCVPAFLQSEEGKIVINHGHTIHVDFSLT